MKFFNRIFWKFFLTIWTANITVMFLTAYVVIGELEAKQFHKHYQEKAEQIAKEIINRHEKHRIAPPTELPPPNWTPPPRPNDKRPPLKQKKYKNTRGLQVTTDTGEIIFSHQLHKKKWSSKTYASDIESASGKRYKIKIDLPKAPTFLRKVVTRFYSYQFILIFITSTLVSALLSWAITRPLKAIGQHSRNYAHGDTSSSIDTDTIKRGDELGDLARDITFMTNKVSDTLNAQQQLLFDVSHELRAPLARMQAITALMETSDPKYTARLHTEFGRINSLIQQILDYSRLNRESEPKKKQDINTIINDAIDSLKLEFPQRIFSRKQNTPVIEINTYGEMLIAAIENILRNACLYTPATTAIDIQVDQNNTDIKIIIRDHGPGVSESDLEKLADPFYRAGNKMHTDGFGLGLSIVKKTVLKHDGTLTLANHEKGGLMVTIQLPRE